jgi:hypothetical protein
MSNIVSGPVKSRPGFSKSEVVLGRFSGTSILRAGIRENLSEFFRPSIRGAIRSGLLVAWESRSANFSRNLRDAIVSPFLIPAVTSGCASVVPEIWSKQTLLKRLQSLSLSYHIVLLAFVVAPFLPELMAPTTTHATSGPWIGRRLSHPTLRQPVRHKPRTAEEAVVSAIRVQPLRAACRLLAAFNWRRRLCGLPKAPL